LQHGGLAYNGALSYSLTVTKKMVWCTRPRPAGLETEKLRKIIETAQQLLRQAEILLKQSQEIIKENARLVEQKKREDKA